MSTYTITAAGETALEIIRREGNASVMGVTSRGVFCLTASRQVIFLSYENWRGPLTVNLHLTAESDGDLRYLKKEERSHPQSFDRLVHGSPILLSAERIRFESEELTILTTGVSGWRSDTHPHQLAGLAESRSRLEGVARKVLAEGSGKGWIGCLPFWVGFDYQGDNENVPWGVEDELQHLADGLRARNSELILLHTGRLMGRGTGLTPSGDDFVIGLLLGLRVTQEFSAVWSVVNDLSDRLLLQARQKTTTLAANLIGVAMRGQADERLVTALEGMLWGSLPEAECAGRLVHYGGSSGGDTLLGMAMALSLE